MSKDIKEEDIVEEVLEETEEENQEVDELKELEEKYQTIENKYQRLIADYENLKRRGAAEVIDSKNKAKEEIFGSLLDIIDNFDRSMTFDIQTKEFKDGVQMLHKMFKEKLNVLGLEEVDTKCELDPKMHQAVMVDTVEGLAQDEIIDVLQKGYCVGEKILRPAMVKVNKVKEEK